MTVWQVVALLEARRAKVRSEITELQGEGVAVVVDADSLFLCELLGLVVDLESGQVLNVVPDDRFTIPATASVGPNLQPSEVTV
ncbi:MAG: hypothetical protein DYG89_33465 [Caldilinea sp. CFX5]|nr:hypothetical protein [Caldilinea sp. CFX5]